MLLIRNITGYVSCQRLRKRGQNNNFFCRYTTSCAIFLTKRGFCGHGRSIVRLRAAPVRGCRIVFGESG